MPRAIETIKTKLVSHLDTTEEHAKNVSAGAEARNTDWLALTVKKAVGAVDGVTENLRGDLEEYKKALGETNAQLRDQPKQVLSLQQKLADQSRELVAEKERLSKAEGNMKAKDDEIERLKTELENLRLQPLRSEPTPESAIAFQKRPRETHQTSFGYSPEVVIGEKRRTPVALTGSPEPRLWRRESTELSQGPSDRESHIRSLCERIAKPQGWTEKNEETFLKQLTPALGKKAISAMDKTLDKAASGPQTKKAEPKCCLSGELAAKGKATGDKTRAQCGYCGRASEAARLCVWLQYYQGVPDPIPRDADGHPSKPLQGADLEPKTVMVDGKEVRWMLHIRQ
ncbi:MAG: hypothetical protein Q9160_001807 [Pyrenula sp. 1 TL-2023]